MNEEIANNTKLYGIVPAFVVDNADPLNLGRVRVRVPVMSIELPGWARVLTPMAGKGRGTFFLPQVGDEVLVMFERGDVNAPYVIGGLWSEADPPPPEANEGQPRGEEAPGAPPKARAVDRCVIRSTSGHVIILDDTSGKEKITVVDRTGANSIEIDSAANRVSIASAGDLAITAGGSISLATDAGDVSIRCKSLTVDAKQSYGLRAPQGKVEALGGLDLQCMAGVKINNDGLVVT